MPALILHSPTVTDMQLLWDWLHVLFTGALGPRQAAEVCRKLSMSRALALWGVYGFPVYREEC